MAPPLAGSFQWRPVYPMQDGAAIGRPIPEMPPRSAFDAEGERDPISNRQEGGHEASIARDQTVQAIRSSTSRRTTGDRFAAVQNVVKSEQAADRYSRRAKLEQPTKAILVAQLADQVHEHQVKHPVEGRQNLESIAANDPGDPGQAGRCEVTLSLRVAPRIQFHANQRTASLPRGAREPDRRVSRRAAHLEDALGPNHPREEVEGLTFERSNHGNVIRTSRVFDRP